MDRSASTQPSSGSPPSAALRQDQDPPLQQAPGSSSSSSSPSARESPSNMDNIRNNTTGAFDLNDDSSWQKEMLELLKKQIVLRRKQTLLQQKLLAVHEARLKRKAFENDLRIMDIDLNTLSGATQKYYAMLQDHILTRLGLAKENDKGPSA
ncbi:hypothetical protein U9M48_034949 [Paspalum notatum var. saurae]|uniref:No apical meristem-associated C-terminal domain-containing protein n=1 Tax=Paspalum notatum var. saurae TaxID=547442 RepID=A0AAQ3UEF1_PASNO